MRHAAQRGVGVYGVAEPDIVGIGGAAVLDLNGIAQGVAGVGIGVGVVVHLQRIALGGTHNRRRRGRQREGQQQHGQQRHRRGRRSAEPATRGTGDCVRYSHATIPSVVLLVVIRIIKAS